MSFKVAFLLGLLLSSANCYAETVALLYPQSAPPAWQVFEQVRADIKRNEESRGMRVQERALEQGRDNRTAVRAWLKEVQPRVVFVLGRTSLDAISGLEREHKIVVGLADITYVDKPQLSAVSMVSEPATLFSTLKKISPRTQRVFVAFQPTRHSWLIEVADRQAKAAGLTLIALRSEDIRAAASHFANIARYANPQTDALWIIDGEFVTDDSTLPVIVEDAWVNQMPVCSSSLQHLTRGVLCATFVEPSSVGDMMVNLAKERLGGGAPRILLPAPGQTGINLRVAGHLGLPVNLAIRRSFDAVVGE